MSKQSKASPVSIFVGRKEYTGEIKYSLVGERRALVTAKSYVDSERGKKNIDNGVIVVWLQNKADIALKGDNPVSYSPEEMISLRWVSVSEIPKSSPKTSPTVKSEEGETAAVSVEALTALVEALAKGEANDDLQ